MAIETLQDYNAQASCCCPQILCPIPEEVCESIQVDLSLCGTGAVNPTTYSPWTTPGCEFTQAIYKVVTIDEHQDRSDVGGYVAQNVTTYSRTASNSCTFDTEETDGIDGGEVNPGDFGVSYDPDVRTYGSDADSYWFDFVRTGTFGGGATWDEGYRVTYSGKVTDPLGELIADADTLINAAIADPEIFMLGLSIGASCESATTILTTTSCEDIDPPEPRSLRRRKVTTHWKIPATWDDPVTGLSVPFPGTYFKITYDIIEEPDGWDDPIPTVFRTFVSEDNVLEWTGPGTGDADDPSWLLPVITIDPPSVPGTRRIVNRRLVCRENWGLGVLPQVWGESIELPDP